MTFSTTDAAPHGTPETTVLEVYEALTRRDIATLHRLLADDFHADLTPGMPWGLGSHPYESAEAMIQDAWGRVAVEMDLVPRPARVHVVGTDVIVRGAYVGRSRVTGASIDAWFAHFWSTGNGRVTGLVQVTDTVAWVAATSAGG